MHIHRATTQSPEDRTAKRRLRLPKALAAAVVGVAAVATTAALATSDTASASTLNGVASLAAPNNLSLLSSGGSATPFTVDVPAGAACTGDTATSGYHVYSYLIQQGSSLNSVTFTERPSSGLGFVDNSGTYYGAANTAIGTGQIVTIPNDLQFAPLVTQDSVPLSTLLYTGGTSGVWEGGIACANSSGVVTDNWNTEVTFSASGTDANGFVWSAVPGPSGSAYAGITSANNATFTEGVSNSFPVTATGTPAPTVTETGALPSGVTFSGGTLSGTPTVSGTFHITLTATNGIGSPATQSFTLTVDEAPTITSANSATFNDGTAGTFTVTATGLPVPTVSESGTLPTGVTFSGGVLSGTATQSGDFPITFTAHNGVGSDATQSFTLTVTAFPTITSANATTFVEGTAGTFTVTTTGDPSPTVSESGALPSGVTFSGGVLSGTPTQDGAFPVTFTAQNGVGSDATQSFTLTVDSAPVITSAATTTFHLGVAGTFTVAATGTPAPVIYEAGALPAGVTFVNGVFSGTPSTSGTFPVFLAAINGVGSPGLQTFTLIVDSLHLSTTTVPDATLGQAYSYTLVPVGGLGPYKFKKTAGTLPKGIKLSSSGVLSGTPSLTKATAGDYTITVSVSDSGKKAAKQTATANITLHLS